MIASTRASQSKRTTRSRPLAIVDYEHIHDRRHPSAMVGARRGAPVLNWADAAIGPRLSPASRHLPERRRHVDDGQ
jgi:hypothetical protein